MNKPLQSIRPNLVERVRALAVAGLSGARIIRELNGVHPIEIKTALVSVGEIDLAKSIFESVATELPHIHEIEREDNPILNFWPFTVQSASQLAEMTQGFSSVALLGVPTLYAILRNQLDCDVHLFERDDYLLREETSPGFHKCDVTREVSRSFDNKFDLVIGDPPWYFDEYCAWLATAERIVKPGGSVMFVLFPGGMRDSAPAERNSIFALAQKAFAEVVLSDVPVEYETPSFEQIQMIRSGIKPINWRYAALLIARAKKERALTQSLKATAQLEDWVERRVGSGRLFVNSACASNENEFLQAAQMGSRFLMSPSRRDPARKRANVISSRGHGLVCSNPDQLLRLVERLNVADDIATESGSLFGESRKLFEELVLDLWPRYICL